MTDPQPELEVCPACRGSGKILVEQGYNDDFAVSCPHCNGSGQIRTEMG